MNSTVVRKIFWPLALIGVIANLGLDTQIYETSTAPKGLASEFFYGSTLDAILFITLSLIFWIDLRSRQKTEKALHETVEKMTAANQKLIQSNINKTNLLKTAVHDLKNPLFTIQGFADMIHSHAQGESVIELSQRIQRISEGTLSLVNSMLEASVHGGETALAKSQFDLAPCLREVCQDLQVNADRKHQTIKLENLEENVVVEADRDKIRDVFFNLLGNAIKFSPPGTEIFVDCKKKQNIAQVWIEDEGPGFTNEDRKQAFKLGQKLSAQPTGGESSTGMGLYSVKQTVDQHGGSIDILNPRYGERGACFRLNLPLTNL